MSDVFPLLDFLTDLAAQPGATDITLTASGLVAVRCHAKLSVSQLEPLRTAWKSTLESLFPRHGRGRPSADRRVFCSASGQRFHFALAADHQGELLSVRPLPDRIPSTEELELPSGIDEYFQRLEGGLFLVAGPADSGKAATIAALLQSRAASRGGRFVSIEDPVEYLHPNTERSLFLQRELGWNVPTYLEGLVDALQMNPDVVFVQELRDADCLEMVLHIAQSGLLVVASLSASSVASVPERLLALLKAPAQEALAREALAQCLEGVVMQRCYRGPEGSVPLFEILLCRDGDQRLSSVERLLRHGNWAGLRQEIEAGAPLGMCSFQNCFRGKTETGRLSGRDAKGISIS